MQQRSDSAPVLHVVVVTQVFPPAYLAEALVTAKLVYELQVAGARVTVVTTDGFSDTVHCETAQSLAVGLTIYRLAVCRRGPLGKIGRHLLSVLRTGSCIGAAYFVEAGMRVFRREISAESPDLVYARGLPTAIRHSFQ
jgi:hypothetical protein